MNIIFVQTASRTGQRTPNNAWRLMQKKLRLYNNARVEFAMNVQHGMYFILFTIKLHPMRGHAVKCCSTIFATHTSILNTYEGAFVCKVTNLHYNLQFIRHKQTLIFNGNERDYKSCNDEICNKITVLYLKKNQI